MGRQWKRQLQDWYPVRFLGDDSDVNIATKHPEFSHWKWIKSEQLPDPIVPFKRDPAAPERVRDYLSSAGAR